MWRTVPSLIVMPTRMGRRVFMWGVETWNHHERYCRYIGVMVSISVLSCGYDLFGLRHKIFIVQYIMHGNIQRSNLELLRTCPDWAWSALSGQNSRHDEVLVPLSVICWSTNLPNCGLRHPAFIQVIQEIIRASSSKVYISKTNIGHIPFWREDTVNFRGVKGLICCHPQGMFYDVERMWFEWPPTVNRMVSRTPLRWGCFSLFFVQKETNVSSVWIWSVT